MPMYASHAEKLRVYRERDRAAHNKKRLEWRRANPEKARASQRAYQQRNKEKYRAVWANRDARKRNAPGKHTPADIADIRRMQRGKCAVCKVSLRLGYHVDHIAPLALGGTNHRRNLQLLCPCCNRSKNARDPITFMRGRGLLL